MAIATNQQVQTYADQRIRPHAERGPSYPRETGAWKVEWQQVN